MRKKSTTENGTSGIPALLGKNLPALSDFEREAAEYVKAGTANLGVGGQFLSMRAKRWTFENQDLGDWVDVVLIDWGWAYAYYGNQKFDPNNPAMPLCFAISKLLENGRVDRETSNLAPLEVPDKQNKTCQGCKQNDYGSGDGRGKACKNMIRTSMLLIGSETIKAVTDPAKAPQVMFSLPPTNIREFARYQRFLAENNVPAFKLITRLTLDKDFDYPHALFAHNRIIGGDLAKPEMMLWAERIMGALRSAAIDITTNVWPVNLSNAIAGKTDTGRAKPRAEKSKGKAAGAAGKARPRF